MGGIIVRHLHDPRIRWQRIVMLAPPNQGANVANRLSPFVGWLLKPTPELRADSMATVRGIAPVRVGEIGVIAAREDRVVRIDETHLPEEKAHVIVDGGHSFIMFRGDVQRLTLAFLRSGSFALDSASTP